MDISKIKKLVKQNGDKFIFVENGEPEMVVMSFQEYEKLNNLSPQKYSGGLSASGKPPVWASLASGGGRAELADFGLEEVPETEFIMSKSVGIEGLPARPEDIRLEDLPI